MSAIMSAIDTHAPTQKGENAHNEYGWSTDKKEQLQQLFFQLVRTKDALVRKNLGNIYYSLIDKTLDDPDIDVDFLDYLYKIMLHTRDIINGKGEYTLFYELLYSWVRMQINYGDDCKGQIAGELLKKTLDSLIDLPGVKEDHPYGSWKDFKYILNYVRDKMHVDYPNELLINTVVFRHIIYLYSTTLKRESYEFDKTEDCKLSLLSRWIPREKSKKFGWIARYIASATWPEYIKSASSNVQKKSAERKVFTKYRNTIVALSEKLGTIQIDQCRNTWGNIDFDKQATSITLSRQRFAFQYVDKKGIVRGKSDDRLQCKKNYEEYIAKCNKGEKTIKAARVGLVDLVRDAVNISNFADRTQKDSINLQWKESGKNLKSLEDFIAMVDTSGSMTIDNANPLHAAIGLGIRIAENSTLGKRVLTFSSQPKWINLDNTGSFIDMCKKLKNDTNWGQTTNFNSALDLILESCVKDDLPPENVERMVLAIFSDMQINQADPKAKSMNDLIKRKFAAAGMRTSHNKPYNPCHILYWNLRSTSGFPAATTEQNITMMSGFSPILLNSLCEKGIDALKELTPWNNMIDILNHERYSWTKAFVDQIQFEYIHPSITSTPSSSQYPSSPPPPSPSDENESYANYLYNKIF